MNSMCENCECKTINTVHWFDASCSVTPVNNCITFISTVQSLAGLHFFAADSIWVALQILEQFCPKAGNANPLVAEPETDFNAKWPFKLHNTI